MENNHATRYGCCIHGKERSGSGWLPLIDPSSGEEYARVAVADGRMVDAAVESSADAYRSWRALSAHSRADLLHALSARIRGEEQQLALLVAREAGKPLRAALGEVSNAASLIDYFAEESVRLAGRIPLLGCGRQHVLIVREPVGVVAAITPFNYPLSTIACKMAPAIAVGCTVVAKPDEHTPLSTLRLAELAIEAGLPPGVFNVVTGPGPETGRALIGHATPRLITFTGSTAVGKEIQACSAKWVRKVVLELGGSCPAIVAEDSAWRDVLPEIVSQSFKNSGQYCYRISRIYVAQAIFKDFTSELVRLTRELRVGHPMDAQTQLGPLNNGDIFSSVRHQVEKATAQGAHVATGGLPAGPSGGGFYYLPTVLTNVREDMSIVREEIFGPVVLVCPFRDIEDAVAQANAGPYGLAAYLFTGNLGSALEWAGRLEVGSIWINRIHQAYPEAPFGGMKESGLGREKSQFGLEEFTELKTMYLSY